MDATVQCDEILESKVFYPDTNVLIDNPLAILKFSGTLDSADYSADFFNILKRFDSNDSNTNVKQDIILSTLVRLELDDIKDNKNKDPIIRKSANLTLKLLEHLVREAPEEGIDKKVGISLTNGSKIFRFEHRYYFVDLELYEPKIDDHILSDLVVLNDAFNLKKELGVNLSSREFEKKLKSNPEIESKYEPVIEIIRKLRTNKRDSNLKIIDELYERHKGNIDLRFVSGDIHLRTKSEEEGITSEDHRSEKVQSIYQLYPGYKKIAKQKKEVVEKFNNGEKISLFYSKQITDQTYMEILNPRKSFKLSDEERGVINKIINDLSLNRTERRLKKKIDRAINKLINAKPNIPYIELNPQLYNPNQYLIFSYRGEDYYGVVSSDKKSFRKIIDYEELVNLSSNVKVENIKFLNKADIFNNQGMIKRNYFSNENLAKINLKNIEFKGFSNKKKDKILISNVKKYIQELQSDLNINSSSVDNLMQFEIDKELSPDLEQRMYFDMLMNEDVDVCSVIGPHGSGKTMFALLAALKQVQLGKYSRIRISKPLRSMGDALGFHKGTLDQKMEPWMSLYGDAIKGLLNYDSLSIRDRAIIDAELESAKGNYLFYEPPSYITGKTFKNEIIIIDDAHMFTREEIRMWLSRLGKGAKIIFIGDPKQNTGNYSYLSENKNGLVVMVDRLKGEKVYSSLTLTENSIYRSEGAKLAMKL